VKRPKVNGGASDDGQWLAMMVEVIAYRQRPDFKRKIARLVGAMLWPSVEFLLINRACE